MFEVSKVKWSIWNEKKIQEQESERLAWVYLFCFISEPCLCFIYSISFYISNYKWKLQQTHTCLMRTSVFQKSPRIFGINMHLGIPGNFLTSVLCNWVFNWVYICHWQSNNTFTSYSIIFNFILKSITLSRWFQMGFVTELNYIITLLI